MKIAKQSFYMECQFRVQWDKLSLRHTYVECHL